ncbi:hypothetical protein KOW79_002793 [Hemibagrus wyckioides]|uniref:Uncharacterized protein n=1 Tax=Hemibagrus wyckioides TaxID=337641 RepID=A0A9D3SR90_9TELE|nr:hypothetical protein KOW79_002793 [Hemibagrus wyckioides]
MHEISARGAPAFRLAAKRMCITAQCRVPRFHSRLPFELRGHFQNIVSYLEHPMSKKRKTPDDDDGGGGGGGVGELARAEDFPRSSCADQGGSDDCVQDCIDTFPLSNDDDARHISASSASLRLMWFP